MKEVLYSQLEVKEITVNGEYATFKGYASVFNFLDNQRDIVARGAFTKTLAKRPNVKMLWQHNTHAPIGKFLSMVEDSKGLYVEGEICLGTEKGKESYALLKQGALDAMSIGYITRDFDYDGDTRTIKELDLYEISIVTFPANEAALIDGVKSFVQVKDLSLSNMTIKEFERGLRDAFQCSKEQAKLIASKGFKGVLNQREVDEQNVEEKFWQAMNNTFNS